VRVLAAVALAVALAGCGGGHSSARRRAIFARDCASCHTLTGHDTNAIGGDLRVGHLDAAAIASFARVMPVEPRLDSADLRAVSAYVARR
jgi:mono/diheme cytochrome c family protein